MFFLTAFHHLRLNPNSPFNKHGGERSSASEKFCARESQAFAHVRLIYRIMLPRDCPKAPKILRDEIGDHCGTSSRMDSTNAWGVGEKGVPSYILFFSFLFHDTHPPAKSPRNRLKEKALLHRCPTF